MIAGRFRDAMEGSWHRLAEPGHERPIGFTVTATLTSMQQVLGNKEVPLEGWIRVDGLVGDVPCSGSIGVAKLLRERRLPYTLDFHASDGARFRLFGEKEVSVLTPLRSLGVMAGYVYDAKGEEIGRAVLRARAGEGIVDFIRSWRIGRAR